MGPDDLLESARHDSELTQDEVARRARTSHPRLSAYEHGRKSPTLATARRVLESTSHDLEAVPRVAFPHHVTSRGRGVWVRDRLWRLPVLLALGTVTLPLLLNWSEPRRTLDLSDRGQRARVFEVVVREGSPDDIRSIIDGVLLVALWDERVLPASDRFLLTGGAALLTVDPLGVWTKS